MSDISQITIPVIVGGVETPTTFDIKDATARQLISQLGNSVYWIGVTTTALTDGDTTNPITVNGSSITATTGGMAQYDGEEFIWNGSAWQSVGKNNFGDLAFKSSASGSYTPTGSVSAPNVTLTGTTSTNVAEVATVGTLPSYTVSGEVLSLNPGTLPTTQSTSVVTAVGTPSADTPIFTGTAASIIVS